MPVSEEKWENALASIQTVNLQLGTLLRAFWKAAKKRDWPDPIVAKYYFGAPIIQTGEPKLPENQPFSLEYLIGNKLPFGIIIKNACEVSERCYSPKGEAITQYTPQNILGPGETIGAFELQDVLAKSSLPLINDWTITSGALSIQSSIDFSTDYAKNKLKKRGYTLSRTSSKSCFDAFLALSLDGKALHTKWHTTLIFLPQILFDLLIKPPDKSIAALRLRTHLGDIAWRAISATTERTSRELQSLFTTSGHNGRDIDSAYRVVERAVQIVNGRRPCMVPAMADETLGPFSAFLEACHCAAAAQVPLMRPAFLAKGQVGYMQLRAMAPLSDTGAPGGAQISKLNDVIANVLKPKIENASLRPLVEMRRRILEENVQFRYATASAKRGKSETDETEGGMVVPPARVVRPELENAPGKPPKSAAQTSDQEFFHPHFNPKTLPPARCRFFYPPTVRFLGREDA